VNALVTGGHGFIGSHLAEGLVAAGHRVRALVTPWGELHNLAGAGSAVDVVRADIAEAVDLSAAFDGVDVVFHAAAKVAEWGPWLPLFRTNVLGTANVLQAAERAGVRRIVLVSSVAVHRYVGYFDADPRRAPLDGDLNAYARTKAMAELLVSRSSRVEGVIVRPGLWPFGTRDPVMPRLVRMLRAGVFPIVAGGDRRINTAYVGNLVDGLILAGTVPQAAGRTYVIGDEGAPTWREVLGELARHVGASPRWLPLPAMVADAVGAGAEAVWAKLAPDTRPPLTRYAASLMRHDLHFSLRHAREELGYRPRVTWADGLGRSVTSA
jgi:2-alkyl-3-oxoalkanoate reductase